MESPLGRKNCSKAGLDFESTEKKTAKMKFRSGFSPSVDSQYSTPNDLKKNFDFPPGFEQFKKTPKKLNFFLEESPSFSIHSQLTPKPSRLNPKRPNFNDSKENIKDPYLSELQNFSSKLISEHSSQIAKERYAHEQELNAVNSQFSSLKSELTKEIKLKDAIILNLNSKLKELDPNFAFTNSSAVCEQCKTLQASLSEKEIQYQELQSYLRKTDLSHSIHQLKLINKNFSSGYSKSLRSNIYHDLISLELTMLSQFPNELLLSHLKTLATSIKPLFTITKSLEKSRSLGLSSNLVN